MCVYVYSVQPARCNNTRECNCWHPQRKILDPGTIRRTKTPDNETTTPKSTIRSTKQQRKIKQGHPEKHNQKHKKTDNDQKHPTKHNQKHKKNG